jgi:prevent-host-death family protein
MSRSAHSVPLAEAKNKLSELVERVSRGEEFVITRHQTEVARLIPARPARRDAGDEIAKMRANRRRRSATLAEISAWKKEGRR